MNKRLLGSALTIGLLTIITILFFSQAIFTSGQFFFGDISQNHYPARKLISTIQERGRAPLWNPHISSGQPLYANPSNFVFHPISLLFWFLPFEVAFKSSIILQYLLCAIGMYLLSRELDLSRYAALLSSIAFTFSGFVLSLGHLYNLLGSAAWIPFFLFFFYRSMVRSLYYWPIASLFLVVIFMAADPFFIAVTLLVSFFLLILKPPQQTHKDVPGRLGRAFLIVISAIVLSSFFLLPAMEMLMLSGRGAGLSSEIVGKWSLRPVEMFGLFIPNIFGDPMRLPVSDYWGGFLFQEVIPLFLSPYMGFCVLFLMGITFFKWDRFALVCWILLLLSVFLSLGVNNPIFPSNVWKLPLLSSFRYTSKFFLLFALSAALLAGRGLDHLMAFQNGKHLNTDAKRSKGMLIIPALVTLGLVLFYYSGTFLPNVFYDILQKLLHVSKAIPENIFLSISSQFLGKVIYASGMALIGTLLIFIALFFKLKRSVLVFLFIITLSCDLFIVNGGLNPLAEDDFYKKTSPFITVLSRDNQWNRIYREKPPKGLMLKTARGWKKEGFFWNRMVLLQWTALPAQLFFAFDQNVDRLEPYAPDLLMREAKQKGWSTWKKILDLSSVQYLLLFKRVQDPNLTEVMEYSSRSNHPVVLYRNSSAFPRFFAVPNVKVTHDEQQTLREVLSDTFHPEKEAIVFFHPEDKLKESAIMANWKHRSIMDSHEDRGEMIKEADRFLWKDFYRIKIQNITNNDLELMVQAKQPGFLVVSDTYYPGWVCLIDSQETPIFRTNFIHRGVPFEKGEHMIEFHFRPKIFSLGMLISVVSFVAMLGFLLVLYVRKRRVQEHFLF